MPTTLPEGESAPREGTLPESALTELGTRPFGIYLHVPFCTTRCGYCDFNTYTASELGIDTGASRDSWADAAIAELRLARRVLGDAELPVATVFFGGGTPTLVQPRDLGRVLRAVDTEFGLEPDAEITIEANPESVDAHSLTQLRTAGFTRISLGMQSALPHVLVVLDRAHTPGRPVDAVREAHDAGFEHVNLDLIYGTPGESLTDWQASVEAAIVAAPDHVSAYSLIVEPGTRLAARIRGGELAMPDEDEQAEKYLLADDLLTSAGLAWYEISNWATSADARCRHNGLYWTGADWWGVGPGAHSHVGGVRWWNVKHPAAWARRLATEESPAQAREVLDAGARRVERILLETRLAEGLDATVLAEPGRAVTVDLVADGLVERDRLGRGRIVLTRRGRLLADAVVRDLVA